MADPYRIVGPVLRLLPPEAAHGITMWALRLGLVRPRRVDDDPILAIRLWGRDFPNPVGLAAGFDKHAEAPEVLLALGFGFVEIGSVTPRPQRGNPRPRLFRLIEDRAVINRMGFNSQGLERVAARLRRWAGDRAGCGIVGANLGMNRDSADPPADYAQGLTALAGLVDYFVINVSSPNTPGLRGLQAREPLSRVIERAQAARAPAARGTVSGKDGATPPLLLKIAPDLTQDEMRDIAEVVLSTGIDGLIVGNTTLTRPESLRSRYRDEAGGLSGAPLFARSTEALREMYRLMQGRVPLVGVGGISNGRDAYLKIRAGASLVQIYTALVYEGPGLVGRIKTDLAKLLRADGFSSVGEAVGADLK